MPLRTLPYVLPLLALIVAVGLADDKGKKDAATTDDEVILPVPPDPKVEYKLKLDAKNFTEAIEEEVRLPDPNDSEGKRFTLTKSKSTFEMVYVAGGQYKMGSPESEAGREEIEGPQHAVVVRPFWLAKVETTWDLYDLWYRNNGLPRRDEAVGKYEADNAGKELKPDAITRPTNPYVDDTYEHGRTGKPALCMSHHAAMMFCHWLRLKTGKPYRLPTEAEWEFAARGGRTGPYGFDETKEKLADYAWFKDNSATDDKADGTTHEVGKKKPNTYGLYDMHGNVCEWTLDQYSLDAYAARAKATDPLKLVPHTPPGEKKWSHVVRGGGWNDPPEKCRSAARWVSEVKWMRRDPQFPRSIWWLTEMDTIGFRVCLPADEYPDLVGLKPSVVKAGR